MADASSGDANPKRHKHDGFERATLVVEILGVIALIIYTGLTAYLAWVGRKQLAEIQSGSQQTERAIAVSNRIAEEAARATIESHRLADQAEQSAAATRNLAEAAIKSAIESHRLADAASQANALARRLGDAAIRGNEISKLALVNVQRAFVFSNGIQFRVNEELNTGATAQWFADIALQNIGNTPTRGMKVVTDCFISEVPIPDAYKATVEGFSKEQRDQLFVHKTQTQQVVLGPKQQITAGGCSLNFIQVFFLQRSWIHYYVSGRAEYKDRFYPTYVHLTEYCYELDSISAISGKTEKSGLGIDMPIISGAAHLCETHNCADEECSQQDRDDAARDLGQAVAVPARSTPRPKKP